MDLAVKVFLLHGLGSHPITLLPMELYLNYQGFRNTYKISYPVNSFCTVEESVNYVDKEIEKHADKEKDDIIIIGRCYCK